MSWFHAKKVLVPFDFSDESLEAVRVGAALVGHASDLYVIHALIDLPPGEPYIAWDELSDQKREEHADSAMKERLAGLDLGDANVVIRHGPAGAIIADYAEEIEAGLIVIPSHGYTGVKRLLLGSVAERVVRLAHCPVLVLKQPREDADDQ